MIVRRGSACFEPPLSLFFSGLLYADADSFPTSFCTLSNLKGGGLNTGVCLCSVGEQSGLISPRRRGFRKKMTCAHFTLLLFHTPGPLKKYCCNPPLLSFCHPHLCFFSFLLTDFSMQHHPGEGRRQAGRRARQ